MNLKLFPKQKTARIKQNETIAPIFKHSSFSPKAFKSFNIATNSFASF